MRSVREGVQMWPVDLCPRRTDAERWVSYMLSPTPQPWDQAGRKCLQLREKADLGQGLDLGTRRCSSDRSEVLTERARALASGRPRSGGVLIPKLDLACCKGPQPLVLCIETDGRARQCLVGGRGGGGYWVYWAEERRRQRSQLAARQRVRRDSPRAGRAARSHKHSHPPLRRHLPSLFFLFFFYTFKWYYLEVLQNTVKHKSRTVYKQDNHAL